jgi:hypothetical protein
MTNYCTNQWTIVKFPCGAGGKFLSNCLFLFDTVAHWHNIQGKQETVDYFKQTISADVPWLKRELNHRWNTNFFSRSYRRNNDLTCKQFNQLVSAESSDYFKSCWQQGLTIVDHWAKPYNLDFWAAANKINIIIDDYDLYKTLVMGKLYRVQGDKIISLLDAPAEVGTDSNSKYAQQYQNIYEFPLVSVDEFFAQHVEKLPWLAPWLTQTPPADEIIITNSQLNDYTKFSQSFEMIEDLYQEQIPRTYLSQLHSIWKQANEQYTV